MKDWRPAVFHWILPVPLPDVHAGGEESMMRGGGRQQQLGLEPLTDVSPSELDEPVPKP